MVLEVKGLTMPSGDPFGTDLHDIALNGASGRSGRHRGRVGQRPAAELLFALSGEDTRAPPGSISVGGKDVSAPGARASRRALGLHFVPEERLGRGAVPTLSLAHNLLLSRRPTPWVRAAGSGWAPCARQAET